MVSLKYTDVSEVCTASMILKAEHISETSVYYNETTRSYIPNGSHLHTRRLENLKSHRDQFF
jgi:hypothetical protein